MNKPTDRIGHYRITALLGRGGMGDVFAAEDETLQRPVALKTIRAKDRPSPLEKARFLREARILSSLDHPGICRIYDYLDGEDRDHLVLELIDGKTLTEVGQDLDREHQMDVCEQLLQVLAVAHEADVIHRDLKPDNVMVTAEGLVKVLDFGLARRVLPPIVDQDTVSLDPATVLDSATKHPEEEATQTINKGVLGTPSFMSPEQATGEPATSASDIYSCGLVMHYLLTGASAYGENQHLPELLRKVRDAETLPLTGVDPHLAALIGRMTSCAVAARPSAVEVLRQLGWIRNKPARRNRRLLVVLALVFVVAGAVKYTVDLRGERQEAQLHRAQAEDLMEYMLEDLRPKLERVGRLDIMDDLGAKAMGYFSDRDVGELSSSDAERYVRSLILIGNIRMARTQVDSARASYAKAMVTAQELVRRDPTRADWQVQLGAVYFYLGYVAQSRGDAAEAEDHFLAYYDISRALVNRDGNNPEWQQELAYSQNNLAVIYRDHGRYSEAIVILREALKTKEWLVASEPENMRRVDSLANSQAYFGSILKDSGQLTDALQQFTAARRNMARVVETDSLNTHFRAGYSTKLQREGFVLVYLGRGEEALQFFEQDLEISRWLVRHDPTNVKWNSELVTSLVTTAANLIDLGQTERARRLLAESELRIQKLPEGSTKRAATLRHWSVLAKWACRTGDYPQVLALTAAYLKEAEQQDKSNDPDIVLLRGQAFQAMNRQEEAMATWRQGVQNFADTNPAQTPVQMKSVWAQLLYWTGDREKALALVSEISAMGYNEHDFAQFRRDCGLKVN